MGVRAADRRALARAISLVEDGDPLAYPLVRELYPEHGRRGDRGRHGPAGRRQVEPHRRARQARSRERANGRRRLGRPVEPVLARRAARRPDPPRPTTSSIRASSSARWGRAGTWAASPRRRSRPCSLLDAAGKDVVFVETVGAGQSEVEVTGIADTVLLVLMPGSGDSVQALKAGIMEIPDVIAINKMDHPAAKTMLNEVRSIVALAEPETPAGDPPDRGADRRERRRALGGDRAASRRARERRPARGAPPAEPLRRGVRRRASARANAHLQAAVADDPELQRVLARVESARARPAERRARDHGGGVPASMAPTHR